MMSAHESTRDHATPRLLVLAAVIFTLDQLSKWLVLRTLQPWEERVVIPGFFNLCLRHNTGAAWSWFTGNNALLAAVALIATVALFLARRHFNIHTLTGQAAFGLVLGGILGNLTDRLLPTRQAVVDFLHFYMARRGTGEAFDFPAFNIADSAICTGVVLIMITTWKTENSPQRVTSDP